MQHQDSFALRELLHNWERIQEQQFWGENIQSVEVNCGTRRIRATWTQKMAEDIQIFHPINLEAELEAMLFSELEGAMIEGGTLEFDIINE